MDILVVGCGISGLTTSLVLQRAGHAVRIWARALPPDTTSNVAAAVWYPYKAYPQDRVTAWGATAYRAFQRLAREPQAGVLLREVLDLKAAPSADPWWQPAVEGFRHARPDELPTGYADGMVFAAPVIEMPIYLSWLMERFRARGGVVIQRTVADFAEAFAACSVVVNCAGLGARELAGDRDMRASRGQVLRILQRGGMQRVYLDDDGPNAVAYIVPRTRDIVLGGSDVEGSEGLAPDPLVTADILRRCARLDPLLGTLTPADVRAVACGLRPVRSTVRLEVERVAPDRWLLHNYGHGGAGVTLSWGCAEDVARLVPTP